MTTAVRAYLGNLHSQLRTPHDAYRTDRHGSVVRLVWERVLNPAALLYLKLRLGNIDVGCKKRRCV